MSGAVNVNIFKIEVLSGSLRATTTFIIMRKEEKIDILLASLAQIIADYGNKDFDEHPSVTFLSSSEVQLIPAKGNLPTNKLYSDNPLRNLINEIVETYYKEEEKSWLESWSTNYPYDDIADINMIYDATYCPTHIYHSLRRLKMFIAVE